LQVLKHRLGILMTFDCFVIACRFSSPLLTYGGPLNPLFVREHFVRLELVACRLRSNLDVWWAKFDRINMSVVCLSHKSRQYFILVVAKIYVLVNWFPNWSRALLFNSHRNYRNIYFRVSMCLCPWRCRKNLVFTLTKTTRREHVKITFAGLMKRWCKYIRSMGMLQDQLSVGELGSFKLHRDSHSFFVNVLQYVVQGFLQCINFFWHDYQTLV
jgi:hypothetical protein